MEQRLVIRERFLLLKLITFPILMLLVALSGCSSGDGSGSNNQNQDAMLYQQALANYQAGDYSQASTEFQHLVEQYPNSIYVDNSQYYQARCRHELGDFAAARTLYDNFVDNYSGSNYVDNAVFYFGKSYFDEAELQTTAQAEFALLQNAVSKLDEYILVYSTDSLLNGAQYYTARSFHDLAKLEQIDAELSVDTAAYFFGKAREFYDSVMTNPASIYADNAQYFKAQAFHDEGDFDNARTEYSLLINAGVSTWADDAKYQYAKTYYDQALDQADNNTAMTLYDDAIRYFDEMILSTEPLYKTSNRLDSAFYFKARSYQRQGDLIAIDPALGDLPGTYIEARAVFQQLIDTMPSSTWADNALYQRGMTYYDEAAIAKTNNDYVSERDKLSNAIAEFQVLLSDPVYQTLNSADNSQYYLGRSYQMILSMPVNERNAVVGSVDFAAVTYDTAREAFAAVIQNFPASSWVDNAHYEIANTYFSEGELAVDNLNKEAAFNFALGHYVNVVVNYPDSIRVDNAVFQIAWIYHLANNCSLEVEWFNHHATLASVSANNATVRDEHLTDLALSAPTLHTCTLTLSLPTYNAP